KDGTNYKKGASYLIPKNQRQHRLVKAMFEKRTSFQDSLFYDVSAWTLPLAFNLDYNENATMAQAGAKINDLEMKTPTAPNMSNYAYLMEWNEYYSPKALNMI
ncbi:MAG TPA: zinc carboxypeptidase, partial [Flavobacteriaceae bacterium]|nr:zinc carboxypeptidase [Flavobacteriaceae bacterium]